MLPLITEQHIALTHLIVCSFHMHEGGYIHLNDHPPASPVFYTLWNETHIMQAAGVKVMGMVGGAAPGSFTRYTLDAPDTRTFEAQYGQLREVIATYGLDGMGLDVEEPMSQEGITRLVRRLRRDFGPDFAISLAPVASALLPTDRGGLSGFSYRRLEYEAGDEIDFYNTQFYNGFGTMASTAAYDSIIAAGWPPTKIVIGQLTAPENGAGFVPHTQLSRTIQTIRRRHGEIGGIMGWEYFNSYPGGPARPWYVVDSRRNRRGETDNPAHRQGVGAGHDGHLEAEWCSEIDPHDGGGWRTHTILEGERTGGKGRCWL